MVFDSVYRHSSHTYNNAVNVNYLRGGKGCFGVETNTLPEHSHSRFGVKPNDRLVNSSDFSLMITVQRRAIALLL